MTHHKNYTKENIKGGKSMITNMNRFIAALIIIAIIFATMLAAIAIQQETIQDLKQKPVIETTGPEIITGEFTLFQYTEGGWVNHFYISSYQLDGQAIKFTLGDNKQLIPLLFEEVCLVPGWVDEKDLPKYGYWIPDDLGF